MVDTLSDQLRLLAQDEEDLAVISAHMQDAVVRVGDMAYLPRARQFALIACRFDWMAATAGQMRRCRTGLHFDRVEKVARTGFDPARQNDMLNLLSVVFEPTDPPAGHVLLTFSGGAAVRIAVECVEAQLRDLGPRWTTTKKPGHADCGEPGIE
jgi:hypothetical protein